MQQVIIAIHLMVVFALVVLVLYQKSEGGALGMGQSGLFSGRGQANALTRATGILGTIFFLTSIALTVIPSYERRAAAGDDWTKAIDEGKIQLKELSKDGKDAGAAEKPADAAKETIFDQLKKAQEKRQGAAAPAATAPVAPTPAAAPAAPQSAAPAAPADKPALRPSVDAAPVSSGHSYAPSWLSGDTQAPAPAAPQTAKPDGAAGNEAAKPDAGKAGEWMTPGAAAPEASAPATPAAPAAHDAPAPAAKPAVEWKTPGAAAPEASAPATTPAAPAAHDAPAAAKPAVEWKTPGAAPEAAAPAKPAQSAPAAAAPPQWKSPGQ